MRASDDDRVLDDVAFRAHLTVYGLVVAMLVGIWLLAGVDAHFWPFYPAAGWGIGLGCHHQAVAARRSARLAAARPEDATLAISQGSEPEPDAATRYVVAMFVDVVGSTSLNEALGDERWAAVRRTFRALATECIGEHGGWEANCSGDGILARFSEPAAAARAATAIQRRLHEHRDRTGFAPSVRIGIHSGDAVEEGDDIIGNVVNLAARVSDAAGADQILITEHVADHLDDRHPTTGQGLHTLKGVSRPRHLLSLRWR